MTYEELRKIAAPALKKVANMGTWDAVHLDEEDGKPVIIAVLRRLPIHKFLLNVGIMKKPTLPEQVEGIRCRVAIFGPIKAV